MAAALALPESRRRVSISATLASFARWPMLPASMPNSRPALLQLLQAKDVPSLREPVPPLDEPFASALLGAARPLRRRRDLARGSASALPALPAITRR
jgi:hypothetical protein